MTPIFGTTQILARDPPAASHPCAVPSLDAQLGERSQAIARRCSYGIAMVFSLMLVVLVVVGTQLWSV